MNRISTTLGARLGAVSSLAVIALMYMGERLARLPFTPFDLFEWLSRVLPGELVTLGIDAIVSVITAAGLGETDATAKLFEQLMSLTLFVVIGAIFGAVVALLMRRRPGQGIWMGTAAGTVLFIIIGAVELAYGLDVNPVLVLLWLAVLLVGWGALLGLALTQITAVPEPETTAAPAHGRRAVLQFMGGSLAVALAAWGTGRLLGRRPSSSGAGQPLAAQLPTPTTPPVSATPSPAADATLPPRVRFDPVPGTRPEVTPNEDFYRIDINLNPPAIDGDNWVLETAGLFDNPRPFTLADIQALPAVTQPITLSCISNRIGGDLIGTSRWTGVRLRDLLDELGLQEAAQELYIEAEDGFFESVAMADMTDPRTLLVYGMNDKTLPVEHGFPLRIYIPNRYGMKQPKWITRIEAIGEKGPGYWVERGWSEEARPHIISIIDTVATDAVTEDGAVPIGGIAWAGDRGIEQVEVQVDDGEWGTATLLTPPLSGLTWVIWRYEWPQASGRHTFRVRAVDGTGTRQVGEESGVRPDGATGYHTVTATL